MIRIVSVLVAEAAGNVDGKQFFIGCFSTITVPNLPYRKSFYIACKIEADEGEKAESLNVVLVSPSEKTIVDEVINRPLALAHDPKTDFTTHEAIIHSDVRFEEVGLYKLIIGTGDVVARASIGVTFASKKSRFSLGGHSRIPARSI